MGAAFVVGLLVFTNASTVVAQRHEGLFATLTGAGDTPEVARALAGDLGPGETVLNFEGDGTANLFAAARVPVVAALLEPDPDSQVGRDYATAISGLMRVSDPEVVAATDALGVRYVAVGTSSMYWDLGTIGYDRERLLELPEFEVALRGTDMIVLGYEPAGSP